MTDSLSLAVHAFASRVLMSFSVDETLFIFECLFCSVNELIYFHTYIWTLKHKTLTFQKL